MVTELTPRTVLNVFFRQRWRFLAIVAVALLAGVAYLRMTQPLYETRTSLLVKFGREARPEIQRGGVATEIAYNERREVVQSSMKILQSRDLAEKLVAEVGPESAYPELADHPPPKGTILDAAIRLFQDRLTVVSGTQSNVIEVGFLHPDPDMGAKLVSRLVRLFEGKYAEAYSQPQVKFLRGQVEQAGTRLDTSQSELASFKEANGISNLDTELDHALRQRASITAALFERQAAAAAAAARGQSLKDALSSVRSEIELPTEVDRYRPADEALSRLTELRAREQQLLQTYTDSSEAVLQVRRNIAFAEDELQRRRKETDTRSKRVPNPAHNTAETEMVRATAELRSATAPSRVLESQLKTIDTRIAALESRKLELANLTRQVQLDEENFRAISQKLDEALIAEGLNADNITRLAMVERPVPAAEPARPRKALVLALAMIVGLLLATAYCTLRETMNERISTTDEIPLRLGMPVLAAFPFRTRSALADRPALPAPARLLKAPADATPDASKATLILPAVLQNARERLSAHDAASLLRAIEAALPNVVSPVIQFVTAHGGEGASTVSFAVADIAARAFGKRVLLISTSMREGVSVPVVSLEEIAFGEVAFDTLDEPGDVESSSINIVSLQMARDRQQPPRMRQMFETLFTRLRARFDLVVIDAPAVLEDFHAASLAEFTDGSVLVVEAERTRAPVARRASEVIEINGGKMLGVVLNKRRMHIPSWAYRQL